MSQTKIQPVDHYFKIQILAEGLPPQAIAIELSFLESESDVLAAAHTCREMGIDDRIMRVTEYLGEICIKSSGMTQFCNQAILM